MFGERCSAFGVLFGSFLCFVRWPVCSAWCVRVVLDVLFGVLFGRAERLDFCLTFCSDMHLVLFLFMSGVRRTVFGGLFSLLNGCSCSVGCSG